MIAQELEVSLHMAFVEARQQRHEFITVEHLLMALLDNPSAAEVLRACAANIDDLRKSLVTFVKENTPTVSGTEEVDTQPTLGFQRVIQRAIMHVQSTGSGKKEVTGANVLVAIFGEKDSHAVYYLHQQGVTRLDVVNFIAHGIKKTDAPEPTKPGESSSNEAEKDEGGDAKGSPLEQFTQNLNQLARDGKIDPLIGREHEVERVIQVLCRRRKNNPLLVGEAGVGKTAIAEGLAWRITQDEVPEILARVDRVFARHGRAAGRHQVPRRLRTAAEGRVEAAEGPAERDPVHRRDPHADRRGCRFGRHAGREQPAQAGAVHRRDEVHRCDHLHRIPRHLREGRGAVAALPEDRCHRTVGRADHRDPQGLKSRFEEHHSVKYAVGALQAAAELSAKYINDRHLPDKAIDVIDEAGAAQRILPKDKRRRPSPGSRSRRSSPRSRASRRRACPATTAAS